MSDLAHLEVQTLDTVEKYQRDIPLNIQKGVGRDREYNIPKQE
jgi:hypothetical protein